MEIYALYIKSEGSDHLLREGLSKGQAEEMLERLQKAAPFAVYEIKPVGRV